jgi:hypothetical protein
MDAGVAGDVSIGFGASKRTSILGADKETEASLLHGPGEAMETSLVWLGAQPGARFTKSATMGDDDVSKEQIEALEKQVKTLTADKTAAEQLADENATKATAYDGIKSAAGALADDADGLKAAIEAGNEYRKSLVDTIIAGKRHMKMLGDTNEEVKGAEDFYKSMPLAMLKKEAEAYAKTSTGGSIEGGDPNATGAEGDQGGKGLRDKSVTHKAVGLSQ